jgi:DNA-binding MarR family transcriptional regulator
MAVATTVAFDAYVVDTLMPDLVGHDRKPSAFVVYLYLAGIAKRTGRDRVSASLETIAVKTGLSKSSVQSALRHLRQRGLVKDEPVSSTDPTRVVLRPWIR